MATIKHEYALLSGHDREEDLPKSRCFTWKDFMLLLLASMVLGLMVHAGLLHMKVSELKGYTYTYGDNTGAEL